MKYRKLLLGSAISLGLMLGGASASAGDPVDLSEPIRKPSHDIVLSVAPLPIPYMHIALGRQLFRFRLALLLPRSVQTGLIRIANLRTARVFTRVRPDAERRISYPRISMPRRGGGRNATEPE